jgi:nucleoside-diphosphate-sugar epimerase
MSARRERVLITGASGFVGACLAHDLVAAGQDVHLLLRKETRTWRLADLAGRYTPHYADLCDAEALRKIAAVARPEVIYHLATYGALPNQQDRTTILATNLLGTAHLLEAVKDTGYRVFVNVGSSSEFGHKDGPMAEEDTLQPRTDYAVGKAAATLLCRAEAYQGRPVLTVRVFSAYGPWEDPARLVPYVMGCCLRGDSPQVTSGQQPRDFIYVEDLLRLLKCAAERPDLAGQILHAGTGRRQTVRDMVETIVAVCGGHLKAKFGSAAPRPDEPTCWVASIARTTELTGWQPCFDLRSGVERTWAWFQATQGRAAA